MAFGLLVLFLSFRIEEVNIATIVTLTLLPTLIEFLIFGLGLVNLSSSHGDRLVQNSIIYGIHFAIDLFILVPLTYRVELSKKLFPIAKVKYTFADSMLPWVQIIAIVMTFSALIENYFRNAKGYDITFFFYSYSIVGYLKYSFAFGIITVLLGMAYKEYYGFKTPTLLSKGIKRSNK
ncbi:hypothetical protein BGP78_14765 [Pseudoalteromonas sp. MSK9-3]|nr:hypothetical protein BGP78_14765 [Pseudoalteromonas sp. MSK9-3]